MSKRSCRRGPIWMAPAMVCAGLFRPLLIYAHIGLLIYELVRSPWDDVVSGIMIATIPAAVACFVIMCWPDSEKRTNLAQRRINFFVCLGEAVVMIALLVAYAVTASQPSIPLLVPPSVHIVIIFGLLYFHGKTYNKTRLAPPCSGEHIPFNALIRGDYEAMWGGRPDYSRKGIEARKARKKALRRDRSEASPTLDEYDTEDGMPAKPAPIHDRRLARRPSADNDERYWYEKF